MSGIAKLCALTSTYPYQVVRSRIQVSNISHQTCRLVDLLTYRTMRRHTYTQPYPPPSNGRGLKRAPEAFTVDWVPIWFVFFLELVLLLSYTRIWHGYFE
jgi:hypothetical protein